MPAPISHFLSRVAFIRFAHYSRVELLMSFNLRLKLLLNTKGIEINLINNFNELRDKNFFFNITLCAILILELCAML